MSLCRRPLREGVGRNRARLLRSISTMVALYARAWVEILDTNMLPPMPGVALYARAWVEIKVMDNKGRIGYVALYARAWVEISFARAWIEVWEVALYARAWVEIAKSKKKKILRTVALYARAWVEILNCNFLILDELRRPLREGVGRNAAWGAVWKHPRVALYARAWVEISLTFSNPRRLASPSTRGRG